LVSAWTGGELLELPFGPFLWNWNSSVYVFIIEMNASRSVASTIHTPPRYFTTVVAAPTVWVVASRVGPVEDA
jgi:hypothetical protein